MQNGPINDVASKTFPHIPVMLHEALLLLNAGCGGRFLDGTLGLGGHAEAILQSSVENELCGLDRDLQALDLARQRLERFGSRARLFHLPFAKFEQALDELGWPLLDGALLDLGVSSMQLDRPGRGFSFHGNGPLDMRMDQQQELSAWHYVNNASFEELKKCIAEFGEDPQAARIAREIVAERVKKPIDDTATLANLVRRAYPRDWRLKARRDPATRAFQALRMRVNDEPGQLRGFLEHILKRLRPGGRLAIISFHSLEDRVVKNVFQNWAKGCVCGPGTLVCKCNHQPEVRILNRKPVIAQPEEVKNNPRASSAKLRAVEKMAER